MVTEHDLPGERPPAAPYSILAHYTVALLGGPLGGLLFSGLSARRLGLMPAWRPALALLAIAVTGATVWAGHAVQANPDLLGALPDPPSRGLATVNRLAGIAIFGVVHVLFGRTLRARLEGREPASPWLAGIGCVALGQATALALFRLGANLT